MQEHLRGNSTFQYFQKDSLVYRTDTGVVSVVPVAEVRGRQLLPTEKTTVLRRWLIAALV